MRDVVGDVTATGVVEDCNAYCTTASSRSATSRRVARIEPAELQLEDHVAVQPGVVAEQVDEELTAADDEWILLADDREAGAELEQQPAQLGQQRGL